MAEALLRTGAGTGVSGKDSVLAPVISLDVRRTRVSPELYSAYIAGENMYPNTISGIGLMLGYAAISAIQERRTTVGRFASSGVFNRTQLNETIDVIIYNHRKRNILSIPERPGLTLLPGEKTFNADDRVTATYRAGVMNVMNSILGLRGIEEGRTYTQQDVTQEVSRFLRQSDNLSSTFALFKVISVAVNSPQGRRAIHVHRDRLDFSTKEVPSVPATPLQKGTLLIELDRVITDPVIRAGIELGFSKQQLDNFLVNLTNPDLPEAV